MILDHTLVFAEKQAITAAATLASTNIYDAKQSGDVGIGEPMWWTSLVAAALVGGTDVQAVLQTSADNSTWTTVASGPVVVAADLKAGKVIALQRLPVGLKRYIRVAHVSTGTFTSGTVSAFILTDVDAQQYMKSGV